jgi:plastocyanin
MLHGRPLLRTLSVALIALFVIGAATARQGLEAEERRADAAAATHPAGMHADHEMTEEEMQAFVDAWFASNPMVGQSVQGTPAFTFRAFSNKFDYNSDLVGSPIDSVVIGVGDIIAWQRLIGAHTLTNGVDSNDSEAGTIFDVPLDAGNPVFQHQYNAAGRFPFFCRTHEDFFMQGVVTVVGATPTQRTTWGGLKKGTR